MFDAIVLEGDRFDWEDGHKWQSKVVDEDGEINWRAAFFADPGCVSCPACNAYHWAEGTRQRCSQCGFEYPTWWWGNLVAKGRDHRTGAYRTNYTEPQMDDPYYLFGWHYPDKCHLLPNGKNASDEWKAMVAELKAKIAGEGGGK